MELQSRLRGELASQVNKEGKQMCIAMLLQDRSLDWGINLHIILVAIAVAFTFLQVIREYLITGNYFLNH